MRIAGAVRTIFLLAISSATILFAQFQQPTADELSMTSDPKAPGASAVYLNIEEITNDPKHFHSFSARIKVLTEKGEQLATIQLPYDQRGFKIADIKGRTIHPDGTIVPMTVKGEDLLITKAGDRQFERKVFTLPSVEVGSILEYHYDLEYEDNQYSSPQWEIQKPYFVHKAHYSFIPFNAFQKGAALPSSQYLVDGKGHTLNTLMWWPILPPGVSLQSNVLGTFTVDVADVPPAPTEEWMPPIRNLLYKVLFYYTYAHNPADFWNSEEKHWSKEVDHFAEPSAAIRAAVAGLVAPGDSDLDKAKKLYVAVQALDNTDFSREKGNSELKQLHLKVEKRAEDAWNQKTGSSEDITLLYLAMLRAAGLTAYAMRVADRRQGAFDPAYMYFGQLDDTLVILSTGGKEIYLDPGEKMCPFQTVHWRHSGTSGARQSSDSQNAGSTPFQPYSANNTQRIGDVTVDEHGAITGNFRVVMNGQEALRWRQAALFNDLDEVKKQFDRWLVTMVPDSTQAHLDHFVGLDDPYVNLLAMVKVEGTLGTATSKRLLLPGFFFQTRGEHPFIAQDKRLAPVDMHYGDVMTDQMTYHFPAAFSVEGAPQDAKNSWPDHAIFANRKAVAPAQITIARTLARAFTFAKPEEYQDLRGFYQKVAAADQQQLVLALPATPKGI